ncbi:hypothetical protein Aple_067360 [Acrocarpospora pleiomorpha]|uniref:Uncharacterized protein n=1 Tax=Acrocarpospora pleiomorpha TaxID=90975 RepID=A0A5M3XR77_9ACTN|nr:hypothetical protein Aple_067360 [Acrocarpospora pleiomorpha]
MTAAGHSDVDSGRYVVDELVKYKGRLPADDRAGYPRAHGKQIKVGGFGSIRLAVDPSRQLIEPSTSYQQGKAAGGDSSTMRLGSGKRGRQRRQPFKRPILPWPHASNPTHRPR